MSKITNDGLTRSGTGCFRAVLIWRHNGCRRINILVSPVTSSFRSSATLPESQSSVLDAQCY